MAASRVAFAGQAVPAWAKTAGRAVHVKIHPQPRNLAESREVLRVLQRYGEVTMYKHLKHEPDSYAANTALAIYQNTNSAEEIINASPLRFELGRKSARSPSSDTHGSFQHPAANERKVNPQPDEEQSHPETFRDKEEWLKSLAQGRQVMREPAGGTTSFTGLGDSTQSQKPQYAQATSIPTSKPRIPKPFTPNPTPSSATATSLPFPPSPSASKNSIPITIKDDTTEFRLIVTRSVLNHQAYIERQPYYRGFRLNKETIMAEDLESRVPVKGLADCQLGRREPDLRTRLKRKEEENAKFGKRKTWRQLWEEGNRARGKSDSKTA